MTNSTRIAKNTLLLYFRQILIMLVSLYTVRVILKTLGATDYGLYNVVAGVVTMFSFLSGAMASASQRYFSFDLGKGDSEHLKKTFNQTLAIYFLITAGAVILAETLGLWFVNNKLVIPSERFFASKWIYQFSVVSLAFTIMTSPFMADIIAREDMNIYAYVSIVEVGLKLAVAFLIQLFPVDKLVLYGLLLLIVTIINTTIYRTVCKLKYTECKFKLTWDSAYAKEMFSFTGWSLFGAMVGVFKYQFVNILLNQFFGPVVNAARSITSSVNTAVNSFSQNFSTALKPQIIKSYAGGNTDESVSLTFRGCKFTYFLMYVFTLPLVLEMETVLGLWLGNPPEYAVIFTRLALIDVLIESISYPIMTLNQATGKIKVYQAVVGSALLLNFPVSWLVLKLGAPPYGVFFVAISICLVASLLRVVIVKVLVGFSFRRFLGKVFLPILCVTIISAVFAFGIHHALPLSLFFVLLKIVIDVLLVALVAGLIGLSKSERKTVIDMIKKRFFNKGISHSEVDSESSAKTSPHLADSLHCTGCAACESVCPKNAIRLESDSEGFLQPVVDSVKCVACGICKKTCPLTNGLTSSRSESPTVKSAYAFINTDESVRMSSSSGGVASLLAEKILAKNGVVFGSCFDEDFNVVTSFTEDSAGIEKFRGSKYVQGYVSDSYKKSRDFLVRGREVLFIGNPCQIGGLKAYLKKFKDSNGIELSDCQNLTTVDFICHGTPSPVLWQNYIRYRVNEAHRKSLVPSSMPDLNFAPSARVQKIAFRRKDCGWKQYSVAFNFVDATEYCQPLTKDEYMCLFQHNVDLRESCYNCAFRTFERLSDITLADFWGVEKVCPQMFDDKGTSLVIVNSSKGAELFEAVAQENKVCKVDLNEAVSFNPSFDKPTKRPVGRSHIYKRLYKRYRRLDKIIENYSSKTFEMAYRDYGRDSIDVRVIASAKKLLRSLFGDNVISALKMLLRKGRADNNTYTNNKGGGKTTE